MAAGERWRRLPPRLTVPFWQPAFTSALCANGFLALLAVLLVNWRLHWSPRSCSAD